MTHLPLAERLVGAAAYLTLIPAVVILFVPAFSSHRFVRFHAWQSIFLWGIFFILTVVALLLSNVAAAMVLLIFGILSVLAMLFLWFVLTFKALQGERFELPFLGDVAASLK
jgi:uncharacterized membrane protein